METLWDVRACCDDVPIDQASVYISPHGDRSELTNTEPAKTVAATPQRRETDAFHEGSHAVVTQAIGVGVTSVTIDGQPSSGRQAGAGYEASTIIALAGTVGERWARRQVYLHTDDHLAEFHERVCTKAAGGWCDLCDAVRSAALATDDLGRELVFASFRTLEARAIEIVQTPVVWRAIRYVAAALMERGTLTGDDVLAITSQHFQFGEFKGDLADRPHPPQETAHERHGLIEEAR